MSDSTGRCHLVDHGQAFPEAALNLASARRGQGFWELAELWLGYSALGSRMATKMSRTWLGLIRLVLSSPKTNPWYGNYMVHTHILVWCVYVKYCKIHSRVRISEDLSVSWSFVATRWPACRSATAATRPPCPEAPFRGKLCARVEGDLRRRTAGRKELMNLRRKIEAPRGQVSLLIPFTRSSFFFRSFFGGIIVLRESCLRRVSSQDNMTSPPARKEHWSQNADAMQVRTVRTVTTVRQDLVKFEQRLATELDWSCKTCHLQRYRG